MYRLPEVAAVVSLAQVEKLDWFVEKRERVAGFYKEVIADCDWFQPQKTSPENCNAYYTFAYGFSR